MRSRGESQVVMGMLLDKNSRLSSGIAGAVLLVVVFDTALATTQTPARKFQFEQYSTPIYKGPIRIPPGLHKDDEGTWRDALNKWVAPPEVTYAGKYYLAAHSCGTFCRFYELFDLRTGKNIRQVAQFTTAEDPPKSPDGHPYLTILYFKPDSRLLIAEYHLDFEGRDKRESCRQQYFLLKGDKLRPLSKTLLFCTEEHKHTPGT